MKKLLIGLLFIAIGAKGQNKDTLGLNIPIKDGNVVYEGIVEIPGKPKMDLYNNAKQWFVDYFKSAKDVIQNEDKDQGRIIGKGVIFLVWKYFIASGTYNDKITIQIDCKDGKYRYRIYDAVGTIPSAYTSLTGTIPSRDFTPEALIDKLLGNKNSSPFTKAQSKKTLESLNKETLSTIASLNKAMAAKTDTF